jgi:hypothetical protein
MPDTQCARIALRQEVPIDASLRVGGKYAQDQAETPVSGLSHRGGVLL